MTLPTKITPPRYQDNIDYTTPGLIFQNGPDQTMWTVTSRERKAVINKILSHRMRGDEPPVAAQFLCGRLYNEFAIFPEAKVGAKLSQAGFGAEVLGCAEHLYDHKYDVMFALEYIFGDKTWFFDRLGTKKRWPLSVFFGAWQDYDLQPKLSLEQEWVKTGSTLIEVAAETDAVRKFFDFSRKRLWLWYMGMPLFEPQDISGWHLHNVWTVHRDGKG